VNARAHTHTHTHTHTCKVGCLGRHQYKPNPMANADACVEPNIKPYSLCQRQCQCWIWHNYQNWWSLQNHWPALTDHHPWHVWYANLIT